MALLSCKVCDLPHGIYGAYVGRASEPICPRCWAWVSGLARRWTLQQLREYVNG